MAAPSPVTENSNIVSFEVKADGNPVPGTFSVLKVEVTKQINRISVAEITLSDGSPSTATWPVSDSATFVPGASVEILAGYAQTNTSIFKGIVVKQSLRIEEGEGPILVVVCKDKAVKMTIGRNNAYYAKKKDSAIMSALIGNHNGLSADVKATTPELSELIQYDVTDWDFLLTRATVNGMLVTTDAGKVAVQPPDNEPSAVLTLTFGKDVLQFQGDLNAETQLDSVTASAWDQSTQKLVSEDASNTVAGPGNITSKKLAEVASPSKFGLQSPGNIASDSLTAWSKAKMTLSSYSKVRGQVTFQGSSLINPGKFVTLAGLGERFNGDVFVSGIVHTLEGGDWMTEAELGASESFFAEAVDVTRQPASAWMPGVRGLQIGVVKQIDKDPDSEFRVLVTLPLIDSGTDGIWARLSTYYASNGVGAFFYPEVGDEVILGFMNEDPNFPVIIGSVYSSKNKAPLTPEKKNETKAFWTKEKLKITFDEKDKVITIETPGGNEVVISDKDKGITLKDQNSNKIVLSSSGIEINTPKTLTLKASQKVEITAATGGSFKASGGDIELKGMNFKASGDMEASLKGSMSAKVDGGMMCEVKGTMVKIN